MTIVDIDTHGPIFIPGYPEMVTRAGVTHAEEEIAQEGARMVRTNLNSVLRHQTGYYRSHVRAHGSEVSDGRIVYGPWLEGVGSRNRTTRFKGYFTFRRTTQQLQAASALIADHALAPYIRRLS